MDTLDDLKHVDRESRNNALDLEITRDALLKGCRSISPNGEICLPCQEILYHILRPKLGPARRNQYHSKRSDTPLGWIDRLVATSQCLLCQFFVRMLFTCSPSMKQQTFSAEHRFMLLMESSQKEHSRHRSDLSDITLRFDEFTGPLLERRPAVYLLERGVLSFSIVSNSISHNSGLAADHTSRASAIHTGEIEIPRKVLQEYCDFGDMQSLYDECRKLHGTECESTKPILVGNNRLNSISQSPGIVEHSIRLIDCNSMCLVKLQAKEYFALSYCWSMQQYLTLTRSNFTKLQLPGSLASHLLAPTICDAINLTKAFGKTYLWVDALCIIQDSMEDKALWVSQMDSIYEHAALTIVAAASQDASHDAGLPGVNPRARLERQNVVTIGNHSLIQRLPDINTVIDESRWGSRAWTFQEHMLSKRIILFAPAQFYFTCKSGRIAEEEFCEGKELLSSEERRHRRASNHHFYHYAMMAATFSKRELSYQHDGLNAFQGLVNAMALEEGIKFLCGVPIPRLFEEYLLWHHRTPSVRRGLTAHGKHFPSWAWVGWLGEVSFQGRSYSNSDEKWKVGKEEMFVNNYTIEYTDSEATTHKLRPSDLDHKALMRIESCLLCFKTERSYLQVNNKAAGDFRTHFSDGCYPIMVEEKFAGIFLPMTPAEADIQKAKLTRLEFIALSYGWGWNTTVLIDRLNLKPEESSYVYLNNDGEREVNTSPYDVQQWDDSYGKRCVNVLYIQWQGSIALRRGVGQIHEDAWMKSKREEIDVRLA